MNVKLFGISLLLIIAFSSCAAQISGSVSAAGAAELSVGMSLEPRMTNLIRSLSAAGGQTDGQVLDGPSIAQSMVGSSFGNVSAAFRNITPSAIDGTVQIININRFLTTGDVGGFVSFEQGNSGGRCEINISLDNGPVILKILSNDIADYLEALMAPLASGEIMDKTEYLSLVTSVYSRAISNEISGSRIRASIEFPGLITSVKGGSFSGRRAEFDIPLLDLLVLENPIIYEVIWR